jgi:hypothetical protein
MGLTVHFELTGAAGMTAARAEEIVVSWRDRALDLQRKGLVDDVLPMASDLETLHQFAGDWLILPVPGEEDTSTGAEILPEAGHIFLVVMGDDCEPLRLGLCRHPTTVR